MSVKPVEWVALSPLRKSDPFEVRPDPAGLSYQWIEAIGPHYIEMQKGGWIPVPILWHPNEQVMIGQIILVCRPKSMTDKAHDDNLAKVGKQMDDWAKRLSGFSGGVSVSVQSSTYDSNTPAPPFVRLVGKDRQLAQQLARVGSGYAAQVDTFDKATSQPARDYVQITKPRRIPRHRLLAWLFHLISVEDKT